MSLSEERKFLLEVIEVYRSLPALWNVKSNDYSNRSKKSEQYDELLKKYNEKYPSADKKEVIKKINSLRTNFRKEFKKIRDSEKSGVGEDEVAEPTLWYYEEMKFLIDQEEPADSINTMTLDTQQEKNISEISVSNFIYYLHSFIFNSHNFI